MLLLFSAQVFVAARVILFPDEKTNEWTTSDPDEMR
jgi:hypothetical protein